jgi:4-amino-4-deoxy-L-arabinose transferase-like glycosyltransferase
MQLLDVVRSLDWSYFDNSGMVAYLIRISTAFFGEQTPFSVRFPFLVLSGFTTYLIYRTSCILFHNRSRAVIAATIFNLTPIALLGGSAAIHDNALLFFWVMALWAAASFVRSEDPRWFYTMGAVAGLAIQSKYTGVLILPCVLIFLLWSAPHRRFLLRKEPWIRALIAAAFALPILWWNVSHQWASLHHIFFIGAGAASLGKRILDGLGYHLAQFLSVSPMFYFALVVGTITALARNLFKPNPQQALLLCLGLPLLLFGLLAFKGTGSQLDLDGLPINLYPVCGDSFNSSRGTAKGPLEMVWRTIYKMGGNSRCGTCALSAGARLDRDTPRES